MRLDNKYVNKILKELTSDPNMTEADLEVTRKKINDGIASLIAKGGLARAGLRTGKGMVKDEDVPDVFFDPKIEGKDTLPFNLSSRTAFLASRVLFFFCRSSITLP